MENNDFKTWAIVEVMGHVEYAGYVTTETIAGVSMLRVDVPDCAGVGEFTKYLSAGALYGITPCSETTARLRARNLRATPFNSWSLESQVEKKLQAEGRLLPPPPATEPKSQSEDDDMPF